MVTASPGFDALGRKINQLQREMSGEAAQAAMTKIGVAAKKDAVKAVKADLGDETMSGWWRATARRPTRKPIPIVTAFDVVGDTLLEITPRGSAKGPWRVLEEGRKASSKGDTYTYTRRRKTKTKGITVSTSTRKRKRNSGTTPPKHTWSEAVVEIKSNVPRNAHRYFVVEPMTRLFKR
jgi:hypothetical protein